MEIDDGVGHGRSLGFDHRVAAGSELLYILESFFGESLHKFRCRDAGVVDNGCDSVIHSLAEGISSCDSCNGVVGSFAHIVASMDKRSGGVDRFVCPAGELSG